MVDYHKLDPHIKDFLDRSNAVKPPQLEGSIEQGRKDYLNFALYHAGRPLSLPRVEDELIPSYDPAFRIPIRIYTPELNKTLPVLIYYHGGGWQRGDLATHDSICRHFSHYARCIVVSVAWRLAPEHKFPVGLDDALAAYEWVISHGKDFNMDVARLAVGGDSAGGNITAATTLRLREMSIPKPIFQLLLYPSLDLSCQGQSYIDFKEGFFLTTDRVKYYISAYIRTPQDIENPLCSPLKASHLEGLPPAHIVTCGFDPLRSEGEAYAKRLKESKVPVTHHCYEGFIHAFLHMNDSVPGVEKALQEISACLRKGLGGSGLDGSTT